MVGKLALFAAPTLIANLLNITFSNFEIKADCCCNSRGTDRHTDQSKYASGVPVAGIMRTRPVPGCKQPQPQTRPPLIRGRGRAVCRS